MKWRRLGDLSLWGVLAFCVVAESGARDDPYWFTAICLAVLAFAVPARRNWPLVVLGVVSWTELVILSFGLGTSNGVQIALVPAICVLSYLAGRRETRLRHFVLLCGCSLIGMLLLTVVTRRDAPVSEAILNWLILLLMALIVVVLPWLIGRYRAQQALLVTAGWERAERIEREQQMEIDQERLRERSRIAEDMHDSVGHELSLIALRAAALELDPTLPEQHRRAAGELRESAATATERLGEVVGVLRDQEAPTVPHDETVRALVDRAAASGLAVQLTEDVDGDLAPMVDRAVHRVVQESLTNASKHAPGAAITVRVSTNEDDVHVVVTDTGATQAVTAPSGGRGLDGLRERVRLAGGTFDAGPWPDGGFEVAATMPRAGGRPGPPTAAVERATVRRSARRGLIMAIAMPVLLGTLVSVVAMGYYLLAGYSAILQPEDYDALTVGQAEAEVAKVLPRMEMIDPPSEGYVPPDTWSCRYYRPAAPFTANSVYRLCFADDALVAKAIVQSGSVPPTPEGNR
ncbi:histidine kinase [Kribbella sp. NPDC048915]|uniref:sensor histidine kinase n=1 Tax=Kribbella sp. NPDC048915 TaxID=3155148 RepID=UPI0033EEDC22